MKSIMLTFFILCFGLLSAVSAYDYLISAYTQYDLWKTTSNTGDRLSSLGQKLQSGGFNAASISIGANDIIYLNTAISSLGDRGVKTVLSDHIWDLSTGKTGIYAMGKGNYLKMQAEYQITVSYVTDVNGDLVLDPYGNPTPTSGSFVSDNLVTADYPMNSDVANYVFTHDTGSFVPGTYSNSYAWKCDPSIDSEGYALRYPRFRWKPENQDISRTIGYDFKMHTETSTPLQNRRLYITVAMNFPKTSGYPVASVSLLALKKSASDQYNSGKEYKCYAENSTNYLELPLQSCNPSAYQLTLYDDSYLVPIDVQTGFYLFEYYVEIDDSIIGSILTSDFCYHLNPRVYWHEQVGMEIDYIIIKDDLYRSVSSNASIPSNYLTYLDSRFTDINNLDTNNNIIYHYTHDEPFQGQFKMYEALEANLPATTKLITATHLEGYDSRKVNIGERYEHYINFLNTASPNRIALDAYPLKEFGPGTGTLIKWNNNTTERFVQSLIDEELVVPYRSLAKTIRENSSLEDTELFFIPQIFGEYVKTGVDIDYWRYFMPPRNMIKCLQLLPLCFSADGVMSFCVASHTDLYGSAPNQYNRVAPLKHDSADYENLTESPGWPNPVPGQPDLTPFQLLSEANQKIAVYGTKIRESLNWIDSDVLMVNGAHPDISMSQFFLDDLDVEDSNNGTYSGYVQCGYYNDPGQNPSFMLVNRRCVKKIGTDPQVINNSNVHTLFEDMPPQNVVFSLGTSATSRYGDYVALFDDFDDHIYHPEGQSISVPIEPGDGKLVHMIGSIPDDVTSSINLSTQVIISGQHHVYCGASVNIAPGTNVLIKKDTLLHIYGSMFLKGNIIIEDNVTIYVAPSAWLDIDDANCQWGNSSHIIVLEQSFTISNSTIAWGPNTVIDINDSDLISTNSNCTWGNGSMITLDSSGLIVDSGTWDCLESSNSWQGVSATNSSIISFNNFTFKKARLNYSENSDLFLNNCTFEVPYGGIGWTVNNTEPGYTTNIVNTDGNRGFFGLADNTIGIALDSIENAVNIRNVKFANLTTGIWKTTNISAPDSIILCSFIDCKTGIQVMCNEYNGRIQNCGFHQSNLSNEYTGIRLISAVPIVFNCQFTNMFLAIDTELSLDSGLNSGVFQSNFINCVTGIRSRGSSIRFAENYLTQNQTGLLNLYGSNLNLSSNANNVFNNHPVNIKFFGLLPYESSIQLFSGHNDFYHLFDDQAASYGIDFEFDENYYNYPLIPDYATIDVSRNWFQDDTVIATHPENLDFIYYDSIDPGNNMPAPPPENDRLCLALGYESEGLYDDAIILYKSILDDNLELEKRYMANAADGIFRLSNYVSLPNWNALDFFDAKAIQYAIDDPYLSKLLWEYLNKCFIVNKEYQSAIDLIQIRIDNPISEVDSLLAVLDLEIVLLLAAMDDSKKPITTKYVQYRYQNHQVFTDKHNENLTKLYDLLQRNSVAPPISTLPLITGNYPNPFNPSTTINYTVPQDGYVKLIVYNLRGQKVKELINGEHLAGNQKIIWTGTDASGRSVSSGVYFVRVEQGGKSHVRKMMLLK